MAHRASAGLYCEFTACREREQIRGSSGRTLSSPHRDVMLSSEPLEGALLLRLLNLNPPQAHNLHISSNMGCSLTTAGLKLNIVRYAHS